MQNNLVCVRTLRREGQGTDKSPRGSTTACSLLAPSRQRISHSQSQKLSQYTSLGCQAARDRWRALWDPWSRAKRGNSSQPAQDVTDSWTCLAALTGKAVDTCYLHIQVNMQTSHTFVITLILPRIPATRL